MEMFITVSLITLLSTSNRVAGQFRGDPYSEEGCGRTRGCFDCRDRVENPDTCRLNIAWEPFVDDGMVKFSLWGTPAEGDAHISMGITASRNMHNADVYSCINDDAGQNFVRSWNPSAGRITVPRDLIGVFDETVTVEDGEIRCQFTRNMTLGMEDPEFFDIGVNTTNTYYLILSVGDASGGQVRGHLSTGRAISNTVILSEVPYSAAHLGTQRFGLWSSMCCLIASIYVTMATRIWC